MFHIPAHISVESLQAGHIFTVELGKRDEKMKITSAIIRQRETNKKLRENI